jgi:hypothetical protein
MRSCAQSFLLLLLAPALALGCSNDKDKPKTTKTTKEAVAEMEAAKVVATPPRAPVEVRTLPEDTGEHAGKLRFALSHGSTDTDGARGLGIDANGDYMICGYFKGKEIFGAEFVTEDASAYLAKLSGKDGSVVWAKELGGKSADTADALAVAADGSTTVVGSMSGEFNVGDGALESAGADDIFIARFAPDGRRLWVKRIGAKDVDAAHAVTIDKDGNSYVTGVFRGTVKFGEEEIASVGDADIFITKLDPKGQYVWTKTFGAIGEDYGRDLAIDSAGNLVVLAEISYKVDLGGGELSTNGNRDIVLAKFDSAGQHLWSKSMGNSFDDLAISVAVDSSDNLLFTGSFEDTVNLGGADMVAVGRSDMFVAKFDTNGKHRWSTSFGSKDKDWGNSIATDEFGNAYITGWFWFGLKVGETELKSNGKEDALLMKLSAAGQPIWAKSFGSDSRDMGKAVAVDAKGGVVTIGSYNREVDLGSGVLTPVAGDDPKIVKGDFYLAAFDR